MLHWKFVRFICGWKIIQTTGLVLLLQKNMVLKLCQLWLQRPMMNSGLDWMTYGQRGCLTGAITPLWASPAGLMENHPCPQTQRTVFWSLERWDASRGCNVDVQDVPLTLKHVHMDAFYPERPIFLPESPRKLKESKKSFLVEFLQAYIFFIEHMYLNQILYKMKLFFYAHQMAKTIATMVSWRLLFCRMGTGWIEHATRDTALSAWSKVPPNAQEMKWTWMSAAELWVRTATVI